MLDRAMLGALVWKTSCGCQETVFSLGGGGGGANEPIHEEPRIYIQKFMVPSSVCGTVPVAREKRVPTKTKRKSA